MKQYQIQYPLGKDEKSRNHLFKIVILGLTVSVVVFAAIFLRIVFSQTGTSDQNAVRLTTKEEVFQMVEENQAELEEMVSEMRELYQREGKYVHIEKGEEKYDVKKVKEVMDTYSIKWISAGKLNEKEMFEVQIGLGLIRPETIWGFYYTEDGEPLSYGEGELVKADNIYIQKGNRIEYETEKIVGNWYYYQCRAW